MTTTATDRTSLFVNPWINMLWVLAGAALLIGMPIASTNYDVSAYDHNPAAFALGLSLMGIGGMLLTGLLVAGAVCWQMQRR